MSLTPRSFLRSPTLLVAAVVSVAIAMLGLTLFASVFLCGSAPKAVKCKKVAPANVDQLSDYRDSSCAYMLQDRPATASAWTEHEFVSLALCLQEAGEHELSVSASVLGLRYYPGSEALHNLRGIGLIEQERWEEAVHALRTGLRIVKQPTTGTMENNLAWAGLYASNVMTLSEARHHYQNSLRSDGGSCEAIHTGMWVEYGVASRSNGSSRDAAIAAYQTLRQKYGACTQRAIAGDLITKYEVAGAAILDTEITKLVMVQQFERFGEVDERRISWKNFDKPLLRIALQDVEPATTSDIEEACEAIAPVLSARTECSKSLQDMAESRR